MMSSLLFSPLYAPLFLTVFTRFHQITKGKCITFIVVNIFGNLGLLGFADHLFDRQAQLLCRGVDLDYSGGDRLSNLELLENFFSEVLIRSDQIVLRDKSFDITQNTNEYTEVGHIGDLSANGASSRIVVPKCLPRIPFELLHTETNMPSLSIHTGHHDIDHITLFAEIAHVPDFLGPRDIVDMEESIDSLFKVYECTTIGDLYNRLGKSHTVWVSLFYGIPRILLELLESKAHPLLVQVVAKNLRFDHIANRQKFLRIIDALCPREF